MQLGVALLVALERGSGAVVAPAVELDDEVVRGEVGVDLVSTDVRIRERAWKAVTVTEVEKRGLEVAAGVGKLLLDQLPDPRRAGSTGAQRKQ